MPESFKKYLDNIYCYFKILDEVNNELKTIIKSNKMESLFKNEYRFYNLSCNLLRLLPYKVNSKDNSLYLDQESGIFLIRKNRNYITEQYRRIIKVFKK